MGAIEFSDSIRIARGKIDLWDLLDRKRNGIRASTSKIRRLMRLTGEMTGFQETIPSILIKRKTAMSEYKKLKKTANMERVKFGKRLMKARATERGTSLEAQEKQLRNAFGQRKLAQQVKRLTGKQRGAPLRSVNAPQDTNPEQRVEERSNDKLSIEEAFIGKGTRRFSQTNGGPLMQPHFVD